MGSAHPSTLNAVMALADLYVAWQRFDIAASTLEEVIPAIRTRGSDGSSDGIAVLSTLAQVYTEQGRWEEAIDVLLEAQELAGDGFDSRHPLVQRISEQLQSLREKQSRSLAPDTKH